MQYLTLNTRTTQAPTRDLPSANKVPDSLPDAKEIKIHPSKGEKGAENASLFFVGNATTILEWEGIRLMTDPNFLHAGGHVHLGPGVSGTRRTNPAVDLHDLPRIDAVLLSHYHGDHFDQEVEESLRRDLPIITTPHARSHLTSKGSEESFTNVFELDPFRSMMVDIQGTGAKENGNVPRIKVTGMPGKHVPAKFLQQLNELVHAIPPTNGWMLELGYGEAGADDRKFECGYRIYISGDTLMVDELKQIPERYAGQNIDLMLIHLGGTTVPDPKIPALTLMVTMDAEQGLDLVRLIQPDLTIPIHYDDYDVFKSPLEDFKKAIEAAGLQDKVVYLDRKDQYQFHVRDG